MNRIFIYQIFLLVLISSSLHAMQKATEAKEEFDTVSWLLKSLVSPDAVTAFITCECFKDELIAAQKTLDNALKNVNAQMVLASFLQKKGNLTEAKKLYERAASEGHMPALYKLGIISKNEKTILDAKWFLWNGARNGYSPALLALASIFEEENNVTQVKKLYRSFVQDKEKFCDECGIDFRKPIQFKLGIILLMEYLVSSEKTRESISDLQESRSLFQTAAENGSDQAEVMHTFIVGYMKAFEGEIIEGEAHLLKAAEQGMKISCEIGIILSYKALAELYERENKVGMSEKYYKMAAVLEHKNSSNKDESKKQ